MSTALASSGLLSQVPQSAKPPRKKESDSFLSIQMLRGIAALSVVWLHLAGRELQNKNVPHILYPFSSELIGFFAVDTFFIISGFVMCTAHYYDFGIPSRIKLYLQKRFIRLFPFYWLTCVPLLFIKHVHLNSKLIGSFFLLPIYAGRINTVAWTLAYELIFLLVFAGFMFFPRKYLPYFVTGWFACIVCGSQANLPPLKDCGYFETFISPFNIDFCLGIILGLLSKKTKFLPAAPFILFGLCALASVIPLKNAGIWINTPFDHIMAISLPSFVLTYGLLALEQQRDVQFPTPFLALGDASYSVYLVHYVLIEAFALVWLEIGSSYAIVPWSLVTATTIPLICVAVYNFVEKPIFTALRKAITKKAANTMVQEPKVLVAAE